MLKNIQISEKLSKVFILIILGFTVAASGFAISGESQAERNLYLPIEIANIFLVGIAIILILELIKKFGKSPETTIWGYFLIGTILLGSTRLFIIFADYGFILINRHTLKVWWPLLFYLAVIIFFIAGKESMKLKIESKNKSTHNKFIFWSIFSLIFIFAVFFSAEISNKFFVEFSTKSIWSTLGIQHFIALFLVVLLTLYALDIKSILEKNIVKIINPLLISIVLFASDHLWRLLTDVWGLFEISVSTIERVAQVISLFAFLFLIYAFLRARALIENHEKIDSINIKNK